MKRVLLAALVLAGLLPVTEAAATPDPCDRPPHPHYRDYECKVRRLRERNFVVVAVVDAGINPYHIDFRLPAGDDLHGVPPWEFIDGYPRDAQPIDVSLDAPTYDEALARDRVVWDGVQAQRLYFIPGTKIVGAIAQPPGPFETPILEDRGPGHGTPATSVAAGMVHGSDPEVEALVVSVEGFGPDGLRWAASQPWIDVISNSWSAILPIGDEPKSGKMAVDAGKIVAFAAGNGFLIPFFPPVPCGRLPSQAFSTSGPPWVVTVGAVSPVNGQDYCWHNVPPDVSSYGGHWPAARAESVAGEMEFGGTSNATPLTAGVMAAHILAARRAFRDPIEGPHAGGALAVAGAGATIPDRGPLADGRLTREEVEQTVMRTAFPEPFDPTTWPDDPEGITGLPNTTPTTPAYFIYEGYGIVNAASRDRGLRVLLGLDPAPDRIDVDTWMLAKEAASLAIWGPLAAAEGG